MGQLRERIIQAHGGRERWEAVDRIMATLAMGGTAFMANFHVRSLRDVEVAVTPQRGLVSLAPFPVAGQVGVFDGNEVRLETEVGELVSSRPAPGASAGMLRYWSFWDELDRLYVAALTVWHALVFPWLLARPGVEEEAGAR